MSTTDLRCPGPFNYFFGTVKGHITELHCRDCSRAQSKNNPGKRVQVFHRFVVDDEGRARWLDSDRVRITPDTK